MDLEQPDYGTGHKKLSIYLFGVTSCVLLTVLAFWIVMSNFFSKTETFIFIYTAAVIQFLIQLICFLRLNTETARARVNVMSIVFTLVILITIILGSLWIMWNLNYNMMN